MNILLCADSSTDTKQKIQLGVMCHVSSVRCQVSGVRCQVSGFRCQVSCVRCLMLQVTCQVLPVNCHMSLMPTPTVTNPPPINYPTIYTQMVCKDPKINFFHALDQFWAKIANSENNVLSLLFTEESFCIWSVWDVKKWHSFFAAAMPQTL